MSAKPKKAKANTIKKAAVEPEVQKPAEPIKEAPHAQKEETQKEVLRHNVLTKPKLEPLQPGQKYFEAPDGHVIIGEESKDQVWDRRLNDGKGGWINPKR